MLKHKDKIKSMSIFRFPNTLLWSVKEKYKPDLFEIISFTS